ncbi:uncharacterized protein LOC131687742 [Topomyia yanbarensis]|uniref:uncharacterized protein LOC131687742 n=1 Tax=Topomyia yanbarensis TaxID=2498891 RepID=UPI00273C5A5F|nr:uncharacterized protein LOC131687742 [Topomyia yanbarensis]
MKKFNAKEKDKFKKQQKMEPKMSFAMMTKADRGRRVRFVIDSGTSDHMVNDEKLLEDVQELEKPITISTAKAGQNLRATKVGKMRLKSVVGEQNEDEDAAIHPSDEEQHEECTLIETEQDNLDSLEESVGETDYESTNENPTDEREDVDDGQSLRRSKRERKIPGWYSDYTAKTAMIFNEEIPQTIEDLIGKNGSMLFKKMSTSKELLSEKYDIEIQKPLKPRIKVTGISEEFSQDEIIGKLKAQNSLPESCELKIVKSQKREHVKNNPFVITLETDANTYNCLLKLQRVNIGWDRCRIFEDVDVFRCYNCSEYGHKAQACSKPVCCPKCAEGHKAKDCEAANAKCVNCVGMNAAAQSATEKMSENHAAWSLDCPLYSRRLKLARSRIDYS